MEEKGYWEHSWQRRLSRRGLLRGAALGGTGLAAAVVIGCGEEEKPAAAPTTVRPVATGAPAATATPAAKQPKKGGTLNRQFISSVFGGGNLDPHVQQASQTGPMGLFYQTLLKLNPETFQVEPHLAQKWEVPSQTEVVLTLTPGVKFHNKPPANGRELTTQDVLFSLERLRTNDPKFINRALFAAVDKAEAVDKSTIKLTLKQPDVTVLGNLASFSAVILAPEVVEKAAGKFTIPDTGVGTGPFIIQSMTDVGVGVVRNPDYWKSGLPYLDGVSIKLILEEQAAFAAFVAGELDVAYPPGPEAKKVVEDKGRKFNAAWYTDVSVQGLYMNTKRKPFDDPRVTRALRLLIDHEEALSAWAELWFGRGYLSQALPAALSTWDFAQEEYVSKFLQWKRPKDEAAREAIRLLNAAGFTKDSPLKFSQNGYTSPQWGKVQTELLQAQYRRLGQGVVVTELQLLDQPRITSTLAAGEFVHLHSGQVPSQPFDPDGFMRDFYHSKGGRNYGKYSDPKADELIEKQRTIFDLQQRKAAIKEVLLYLIDNAPYTSWSGRFQGNVWQPKVQNFAPEANSSIWGHNYERVWLDV